LTAEESLDAEAAAEVALPERVAGGVTTPPAASVVVVVAVVGEVAREMGEEEKKVSES